MRGARRCPVPSLTPKASHDSTVRLPPPHARPGSTDIGRARASHRTGPGRRGTGCSCRRPPPAGSGAAGDALKRGAALGPRRGGLAPRGLPPAPAPRGARPPWETPWIFAEQRGTGACPSLLSKYPQGGEAVRPRGARAPPFLAAQRRIARAERACARGEGETPGRAPCRSRFPLFPWPLFGARAALASGRADAAGRGVDPSGGPACAGQYRHPPAGAARSGVSGDAGGAGAEGVS